MPSGKSSTVRSDVIVLGCGIAGLSIAAKLAEDGLSVTAIDQFEIGHDRGSSHGDCRIFRRVPFEGPLYVSMAAESWAGWRQWNQVAGEMLFAECGGIDAAPKDSEVCAKIDNLGRDSGQASEVLSAPTFNQRHTRFRLPLDWQVVYQKSSGVLRADRTLAFLLERAKAKGTGVQLGQKVTSIHSDGAGVTVRAGEAVYSADFLVVAAGAWLPELFPDLPMAFTADRRVSAWFNSTHGGVSTDGSFPIFCLHAPDGIWYGMPASDGSVKVGNHLEADPIAIREPVRPPDLADARALAKCVDRYLTGFSMGLADGGLPRMKPCIYTTTKDLDFVIDYHPKHPNVLLFSCCSGHGFKYAPIYGRIAAAFIQGCPPAELSRLRFR